MANTPFLNLIFQTMGYHQPVHALIDAEFIALKGDEALIMADDKQIGIFQSPEACQSIASFFDLLYSWDEKVNGGSEQDVQRNTSDRDTDTAG